MRRAVLVAASRFEDPAFPPLQFAVRDAERLQEILEDPALGGFDQVIMLANPPGNVARIGLERTARACDPGDVLLFYFSGHGKLDRDGSLALAMADSDTAVLGATSLVSDELKRILNLSKASQKIMILDCCYSGAVGVLGFKGALGDSIENLAQNFRGSFLLAASQRFERAWENEEKGAGALTNALVEGVRTGAASRSGRDEITLSEIASYVKRTVPQDSPQLPEYWDSGGIGDVVFSKKPLLFDAEWARKVKAMVTRFVSTQVFDEDFADSIRGAVRIRDDPSQAARLKLLDRLLKREVQISTFVTVWPTLVDRISATGAQQEVVITEPPKGEVATGNAETPGAAEGAGADPDETCHPSPEEKPPILSKIVPDKRTDDVPESDIAPLAPPREEPGDRPSAEIRGGPAAGPPDQSSFRKRSAVVAAALGLGLLVMLMVALYAMRSQDTALNSSLDNATATAPIDLDAVTITAVEDVPIRIYELGGRDLYQGTLRAGERFQVPSTAVSPLISTGRPNAIRVTIGTTPIPSLGAPDTSIDGVSLKPADLLARAQEKAGPGTVSTPDTTRTDSEKAEPTPPEQTKADAPPPRPMRTRPSNVGPFIIFFDWQNFDVTPQAAAVLDNAIAAIRPLQRGEDKVLVELRGHTDQSDGDSGIARGRANSVRRYMISAGIPASAIKVRSFGASQPLVPTADGVREPQNRRVEIIVSIQSPQ